MKFSRLPTAARNLQHGRAVGVGGLPNVSFPILQPLAGRLPGPHQNDCHRAIVYAHRHTTARKADLGDVAGGRRAGVLCSGAYGPSASPAGFFSHGYPNEVLVDGDELHLVRAGGRETRTISVGRYRLPDDLPLQRPGVDKSFSISYDMFATVPIYGGALVDGAHIMKLFGDAVTGPCRDP